MSSFSLFEFVNVDNDTEELEENYSPRTYRRRQRPQWGESSGRRQRRKPGQVLPGVNGVHDGEAGSDVVPGRRSEVVSTSGRFSGEPGGIAPLPASKRWALPKMKPRQPTALSASSPNLRVHFNAAGTESTQHDADRCDA